MAETKLKRVVIIDGRSWGFETPETTEKLILLNEYLASYYTKLYLAYFLSPENIQLSQFIRNKTNKNFKTFLEWQFSVKLEDCLFWLSKKGIDIQNLSENDFPKPIPASQYLPYL